MCVLCVCCVCVVFGAMKGLPKHLSLSLPFQTACIKLLLNFFLEIIIIIKIKDNKQFFKKLK